MATQTVEFRSPPSQTVTAKLFAIGSDTQVASVTATEATNRKGTYSAAFIDVAAGEYELIALVGAVPVARWFVTLTLTTATFQARDKVGAVELDSAAILAVADQVWDEATSGHTTAGTYGGRIVRATNSNTEVQITGSNHIAADIHNLQSGVITAGDFAANSITASALATDAVTEIQSGLATAAALATESGKITNIENASGYLLAVLAGACADPQTASETYAITVFGSTFTVDMAGQTSTGTRTAPTLTKA